MEGDIVCAEVKVFFLTFAAKSWFVQSDSIENAAAVHHSIHTNNHSRFLGAEDNYIDSSHACTSRRLTQFALSRRGDWCDLD